MPPNFGLTLAGISLEHPLMNAAGTCKRFEGREGIETLVRTASSAAVLGSITLNSRVGNGPGDYYCDDLRSHNSLGLPNPGLHYVYETLSEMLHLAHDQMKPLFVSIAGFSPLEYRSLAGTMLRSGADLVELNLGCPNCWRGSTQTRIACFDPDMVGEILTAVRGSVGDSAPIGVKVSPFSDPFGLQMLAKTLNEFPLVKIVTTCNTFPNAFWLDESGASRILPGGGLSGMAGPALKTIGLGQVKQLRALLRPDIQIIGVGGVKTGQDVRDYLCAGAVAVQAATGPIEEGPRFYGRVIGEFADLSEAA